VSGEGHRRGRDRPLCRRMTLSNAHPVVIADGGPRSPRAPRCCAAASARNRRRRPPGSASRAQRDHRLVHAVQDRDPPPRRQRGVARTSPRPGRSGVGSVRHLLDDFPHGRDVRPGGPLERDGGQPGLQVHPRFEKLERWVPESWNHRSIAEPDLRGRAATEIPPPCRGVPLTSPRCAGSAGLVHDRRADPEPVHELRPAAEVRADREPGRRGSRPLPRPRPVRRGTGAYPGRLVGPWQPPAGSAWHTLPESYPSLALCMHNELASGYRPLAVDDEGGAET